MQNVIFFTISFNSKVQNVSHELNLNYVWPCHMALVFKFMVARYETILVGGGRWSKVCYANPHALQGRQQKSRVIIHGWACETTQTPGSSDSCSPWLDWEDTLYRHQHIFLNMHTHVNNCVHNVDVWSFDVGLTCLALSLMKLRNIYVTFHEALIRVCIVYIESYMSMLRIPACNK